MTDGTTDVLISGGGVAGLTAAIAFADAGFGVVCVDPTPPVTDRNADGADLRTTAYLQPGNSFLDRIGVWPKVTPHAAPLQVMRILDASGATHEPHDFDAADVSDAPFGYNVGNWAMRAGLLDRISELPNLQFVPGVATQSVLTRTDAAHVTLTDGTKVTARLLIAADGRASPTRTALGIGVQRHDFGQTALTFAVSHAQPHQNISTEVHRSGGPFTLVPLPDLGGRPCSAVVWMERAATAKTLHTMDEAAFNAAATERSAGVLGDLHLASRRTAWPIISQLADRFYGERTALVAEAAHVVPPIGAQGLNMSLADIEALLDLAQDQPDALGTPAMLQAYHAARYTDVALRKAGVGLLNRVSMQGNPLAQMARRTGAKLLHDVKPIRASLMRLGIGAG